jgi:hypothetical protein
MSNVTLLDITMKLVKHVKHVYENDISKRDFDDFESYEELHDFGNGTTFTGMVLDTFVK